MLFIQYAAPTGTFDDRTLSAVREAEEGETSFNWPKIGWIFVFQYPIIEILCVGIQEATEATGKILLDGQRTGMVVAFSELVLHNVNEHSRTKQPHNMW